MAGPAGAVAAAHWTVPQACVPGQMQQHAPVALQQLQPPRRLRCPPPRDGRLYLRVDWTAEQLAPFDSAAWLTPAVHASASPEAMQPTLDIIKVGGWDDWWLGCAVVLSANWNGISIELCLQ